MPYCRECSEKFHYCSSCEYTFYLDEGFCSEECMLKSADTKMDLQNLESMLRDLPSKHYGFLLEIFDGEYANLEYPYFYNIVKERIKDELQGT